MSEIKNEKGVGCKGWFNSYIIQLDCQYDTNITCEECKYGMGMKDPEAKCNRSKK